MRDTIIVERDIDQLVAEGRDLVREVKDAEATAAKLERQASDAREAAQMRRLELGRLLVRARKAMPRRGSAEKGWLAFLRALEIDDSTAHRYMELARTLRSQAQPVRSSEEPPAADEATSPAAPPDRDTWCTPTWIAEAIGHWGLDPCSNERSHIQSTRACRLDRGQDGLALAAGVTADERVFVNPPYSDVMPWVQAYGHTRFCYLVKFDPSTKWCAELLAHTELVLFPKRTRIEFEPPPGVPGDGGNQFPHGLFFARAEDATPEIRALCFEFHVPRATA